MRESIVCHRTFFIRFSRLLSGCPSPFLNRENITFIKIPLCRAFKLTLFTWNSTEKNEFVFVHWDRISKNFQLIKHVLLLNHERLSSITYLINFSSLMKTKFRVTYFWKKEGKVETLRVEKLCGQPKSRHSVLFSSSFLFLTHTSTEWNVFIRKKRRHWIKSMTSLLKLFLFILKNSTIDHVLDFVH